MEDAWEGSGFICFRVKFRLQDRGNITTLWRISRREVDLCHSKVRLQNRENITTLWRIRGREVDLCQSKVSFVGS